MNSWERLVDALRAARDDGTGIMLCSVDPEDVPRLIAWISNGSGRSRWTPGDRARHLAQLSDPGREE